MAVTYQGAGRQCSGRAQPGSKELMAWFLGAYASRGGVNSGIYNCRPVRGGSAPSLHGEGRACDLGIRPYSAGYGTSLAQALVDHHEALGIQLVIWNRRIWTAGRGGWRAYGGVSPHTDHLHVELTWHAARTLTRGHVQAVLGGATPSRPSSDTPGTAPGSVLRKGMKGPAVAAWQEFANEMYARFRPALRVDADFGDATHNRTVEIQRFLGCRWIDGVVGPEVRTRTGFRG